MKELEPNNCETIKSAATRLIALARESKGRAFMVFSDVRLEVVPESNPDLVVAAYYGELNRRDKLVESRRVVRERRNKQCVKACAGMKDPVTEIKIMREIIDRLSKEQCSTWQNGSCIDNGCEPHRMCANCLFRHTMKGTNELPNENQTSA